MTATRSKRLRLPMQQTFTDDVSTAPPCVLDKRRERKRVTDREAQREHRKRRKEYVEELEAKIELLKQDSGAPEVTGLLLENERLRGELKSLRSFFDAVQDLVKLQRPSNGVQLPTSRNVDTPQNCNGNDTASKTPVQEPVPEASQTTTPSADLDLQVAGPEFDIQAFAGRNRAHEVPDSVQDWPLVHSTQSMFSDSRQADSLDTRDGIMDEPADSLIIPDINTRNVSLAMDYESAGTWHVDHFCDSVFLDQDNAASRRPWLGHWAAHPPTGNFERHCGSSIFPAHTVSESMLVLDQSLTGPFDTGSAAFQNNSRPERTTTAMLSPYHQKNLPAKPLWLGFPNLLLPALPPDARLQAFVLRYTEASSTQPRPKLHKPMILDFWMNNPSDQLSQAVKQYLSSLRGSMGLSELLASFWLISILLRWLVNQDEESFFDLPEWLRPTMLQTGLTQPLNISFMPWPLLRDQLMLETFTNWNGAVEVMVALGKHLRVDLALRHNSEKGTTAQIASFDPVSRLSGVPPLEGFPQQRSNVHQFLPDPSITHSDLLEEVLRDLRNWSLHDHFFLQYPEFRDSYRRSR